jgi:hypothetical protein
LTLIDMQGSAAWACGAGWRTWKWGSLSVILSGLLVVTWLGLGNKIR